MKNVNAERERGSLHRLVRCYDSTGGPQLVTLLLLVIIVVLTAICAVGNWNLYSRVERLEQNGQANSGSLATPQSRQTGSREMPK